MMGRTHMASGALVGAVVVSLAHPDPKTAAGWLTVVTVCALLPDLDHPSSKASRFIPVLGPAVARLVARVGGGHRGLTHSLLGTLLLAGALVPAAAYVGAPAWFPPAVIVGCWTHIAGDAATETGVPLFYPHPARFRYATINTGSWVETWIVCPVMLAVTAWLTAGTVGLL